MHGLSVEEIRVSTGLSERLIGEYLDLYAAAGSENERVRHILTEPDPATKAPAEIKRGGLVAMKSPMDTIESRFEKHSLPDLLVRKFLTELWIRPWAGGGPGDRRGHSGYYRALLS